MSDHGTSSQAEDAVRKTLETLRIDRGPARRRRRRWPWITALIVVATVLLLLWGPVRERLLIPTVTVGAVVRSPATQGAVRTTASGYVVARRRAAISSRLQGRLERLLVDVGDRVEKGQLLGELGHDDLDASVAEAAAVVVARQRDIPVIESRRVAADARVRSGEERLAEAQAVVPAAEERLREAERVVGVKARLARSGAGTSEDLAAARASREVLKKELDAFRAAIPPARAAVAESQADFAVIDAQVAAAEAEVLRAEAALGYAQSLRTDADIRAPFAGVVLRKEAEVGEMVAPVNAAGSTTRGAIVTLADFASLEMEVDVIERDVGKVEAGLPCRIALDSREAPYAGHVRQIVPTADRTRGSVLVKITFDDLDDDVLPEMSGRVEFLDPDAGDRVLGEDAVLLPAAALSATPDQWTVWVVIDGSVRLRSVMVADGEADDRGRRRVLDGLEGGEQVVVNPPERLRDGLSVNVRAGED